MKNILNSGSLDTLTAGNSLLTQARKVNGGKIQLELAEPISTSGPNIMAMFNKSDDRFSQTSARRAWMTVEPSDAGKLLGIDLSDTNPGWGVDDSGREVLSLNVLNPQVDGQVMRVQITETVEPTEYQALNLETAAKRRGADGDFIYHNGQHVFSNTYFCFGEPTHTLLEADAPVSAQVTAGTVADAFPGAINS